MGIKVIALGGNAVLNPGEKATFRMQLEHISKTVGLIKGLLGDSQLVITHGNGPQVGNELLRGEYAKREVPRLPMFILNAETQAFIGSMIEIALRNELNLIGSKRVVTTIVTHSMVNNKDPAFRHPSKPVGPFYSKKELENELKEEKFSYTKEKEGYRKVVPSPMPLRILEIDAIRDLLKKKHIVIAGGGGGIPVYRNGRKYEGIDAVIDKDLATQLIANGVHADEMIILTNIDRVYADYPTNRKAITLVRASELKKLLDTFEDGTIKPKLEACIRFIEHGGKRAYIGCLSNAGEVLAGSSGTCIIR